MLVEIMMSALLVAIAATAVFKGIDGANATSGQSKSRAVAATLAQEDQERLRSMDPRKLASYSPTPVQRVVNGITYTIASSASFVSDRGESESCSKGSGRVTYARITSTVTWPDMLGSKPVTSGSLVAINNAYAKGSLSVRINDAHAVGVAGVAVSVNNPISLSGTTNASGCVVWDGLDTGAYFGSFSKTGYVDPSGATTVTPVNGWNVTNGSTAVATHLYDQAGRVDFSFVGKSGSTTYPGATTDGVTMFHANLPTANNVRRAPFTRAETYEFSGLFPFLTPYSAYAGACTANPATPPSGSYSPVTVPAGTLATPDPVVIEMPVINVRVRRNSANYAGANITIRPVDPTCGSTVAIGGLTNSSGLMPSTGSATVADGSPEERAFPYGSYIVCADDNRTTPRKVEKQIDNFTAGGTTTPATATDLTIPTSGSQGSC
jgi:Tfp pilus assembly protein PilV